MAIQDEVLVWPFQPLPECQMTFTNEKDEQLTFTIAFSMTAPRSHTTDCETIPRSVEAAGSGRDTDAMRDAEEVDRDDFVLSGAAAVGA